MIEDRTPQDEQLRRAGLEAPTRVDAPILLPGVVIAVVAFMGLIAVVPAWLIGAACEVLGFPFFGGLLLSWSIMLGAYVARLLHSRSVGRYILYADRFVSRYPHPRRLRIAMQEDVLKPEEIRHLDRLGHRIILRHGRGAGSTRIDVQDADGLWAALQEWRKRAGGLYSSREAGGPIAYSQPPLGDAGPEGPFAVSVRCEAGTRWILEGSGVQIVLEQRWGPVLFTLAVLSAPLPVVVCAEKTGPSAVYELRRNNGLLLGIWRRTGLREGELTVAGRAFTLREKTIVEGNREIGRVSRDTGWIKAGRISAISFDREPRTFAELAAVFITAVSNADEGGDG